MKTAFIIGGAKTFAEDYAAAVAAVGKPDAVIVANDVGTVFDGPIDAWVSLHGASLIGWRDARKAKGLPDAKATYIALSDGDDPNLRNIFTHVTEAKFDGQEHGGSSGLFAAKVALVDMGFNRVVLCGVPMTVEGGHFFDDAPWAPATSFWVAWQEAMPHLAGKAFSMSGKTKEWLGEPPAKAAAVPAKKPEAASADK